MISRDKLKQFLESKDKLVLYELLKQFEFDLRIEPNNERTKLNISVIKEILGDK